MRRSGPGRCGARDGVKGWFTTKHRASHMDISTSTSAMTQPRNRTWYAEYHPHRVESTPSGTTTSRDDLIVTLRDVQTQMVIGRIIQTTKNGKTTLFFTCNTIGTNKHEESTDDYHIEKAARVLWREWCGHFPMWVRASRFWWRNGRRISGFGSSIVGAVGLVAGIDVWVLAAIIGPLLFASTSD